MRSVDRESTTEIHTSYLSTFFPFLRRIPIAWLGDRLKEAARLARKINAESGETEERVGEEEGRERERGGRKKGGKIEGLRTSPTYCPGLVMNSSNGS